MEKTESIEILYNITIINTNKSGACMGLSDEVSKILGISATMFSRIDPRLIELFKEKSRYKRFGNRWSEFKLAKIVGYGQQLELIPFDEWFCWEIADLAGCENIIIKYHDPKPKYIEKIILNPNLSDQEKVSSTKTIIALERPRIEIENGTSYTLVPDTKNTQR